MSDRDNFGAFLVGFLVGGIAGAVISLLYAPASGEETRTVIKEKAIELKDKTAETAEEAYKKAEIAAQEAAAKAQTLIKSAQTLAADTLKKGQVLLEGQKPAAKAKKAVE